MIVGVSYFIAAVVAEESPRISWPSIIIRTPASNRTELCLRDLCRKVLISETATIVEELFPFNYNDHWQNFFQKTMQCIGNKVLVYVLL